MSCSIYALELRFASSTARFIFSGSLCDWPMLLLILSTSIVIFSVSYLIFSMFLIKFVRLIRFWYLSIPCTNSFSSFFRNLEHPNFLGISHTMFVLSTLIRLILRTFFWFGLFVSSSILLPPSIWSFPLMLRSRSCLVYNSFTMWKSRIWNIKTLLQRPKIAIKALARPPQSLSQSSIP